MPSREFQVEAENILPEGFWPGAPLEAPDSSALEDLMLKAASVLELVGGTFSIVAVREQIGPELWVPRGYVAKWESYAPGRRSPQPEAAAEATRPEPDPAPDDLGPDPEAQEEWPEDAERALAEA